VARDQDRLPAWLWLWYPPTMALIVFVTKLFAPGFFARYIEGENAFIENATPVVALLGFLAGLTMLRRLSYLLSLAMRLWVVLLTLSCLYIAGEEISWGQQIFGWQTPALVDALNDQHETNLHNMSSWFDQKPRLLLELWVLIGGVLVPPWAGRRQRILSGSFQRWFWPTRECLPTALLAILTRLPQRYKWLTGTPVLPFEIRWSELQEYYFALFLLIYLLSLRARLRARSF
jgi:hypothetical protein